MTEFTAPVWQIGDQGQLESSPGGAIILPEPTGGNAFGPNGFSQGWSYLDTRYSFLKDLVDGYTGRVLAVLASERNLAINAIPMKATTTLIAAAQAIASGSSMTLASAAAQGLALNIPIVPFTGVLNSLGTGTSVTTAPLCLDFGFAWGGTTANSSLVTVADSTLFRVGDPLVIAHVGNSSSAALLTNVVAINSTTQIQVGPSPNVPATTNAQTPIGSGNVWGPSEFASTGANSPYPIPIGHLPYIAMGPGLFLDPRQSVARSVAISSAQSASSGSLTVSGWDVFWAPITDTVTITSSTGSSGTTGYTLKTFKAINTVVPAFTDAGHNWSIGTSDVYGFPWKTDQAELTTIWWNGGLSISTAGFTVPDFTATASSITGDVRGTIQIGASGPGTGVAGGSSSGSISSGSLTVVGPRLVIWAGLSTWNQLNMRLTQPQWQFGRTQA